MRLLKTPAHSSLTPDRHPKGQDYRLGSRCEESGSPSDSVQSLPLQVRSKTYLSDNSNLRESRTDGHKVMKVNGSSSPLPSRRTRKFSRKRRSVQPILTQNDDGAMSLRARDAVVEQSAQMLGAACRCVRPKQYDIRKLAIFGALDRHSKVAALLPEA